MKRTLALVILLISLTIYIVCAYQPLFLSVVKWRQLSNNILFRSEKLRYGGLFGFSFLIAYKIPFQPYKLKKLAAPKKTLDLYIIGDSYLTEKIEAANFKNTGKLIYARWEVDNIPIKIDSLRNNVLIIETAESYFLKRFQNKRLLNYPMYSGPVNNNRENPAETLLKGLFFTTRIERNLNALVPDNYLMCLGKEIRADFNQRIFNKIDSSVVISNDKKYLLLSETVDTASNSSSFKKLTDESLNKIVDNCNTFVNYYQQLGFKKIILSIIPNTTSIIGYKNYTYNLLIPRVEANPNRNFHFINVYDQFLKSSTQLYFNSDPHWNSAGLQLWVDDVNNFLD